MLLSTHDIDGNFHRKNATVVDYMIVNHKHDSYIAQNMSSLQRFKLFRFNTISNKTDQDVMDKFQSNIYQLNRRLRLEKVLIQNLHIWYRHFSVKRLSDTVIPMWYPYFDQSFQFANWSNRYRLIRPGVPNFHGQICPWNIFHPTHINIGTGLQEKIPWIKFRIHSVIEWSSVGQFRSVQYGSHRGKLLCLACGSIA